MLLKAIFIATEIVVYMFLLVVIFALWLLFKFISLFQNDKNDKTYYTGM